MGRGGDIDCSLDLVVIDRRSRIRPCCEHG